MSSGSPGGLVPGLGQPSRDPPGPRGAEQTVEGTELEGPAARPGTPRTPRSSLRSRRRPALAGTAWRGEPARPRTASRARRGTSWWNGVRSTGEIGWAGSVDGEPGDGIDRELAVAAPQVGVLGVARLGVREDGTAEREPFLAQPVPRERSGREEEEQVDVESVGQERSAGGASRDDRAHEGARPRLGGLAHAFGELLADPSTRARNSGLGAMRAATVDSTRSASTSVAFRGEEDIPSPGTLRRQMNLRSLGPFARGRGRDPYRDPNPVEVHGRPWSRLSATTSRAALRAARGPEGPMHGLRPLLHDPRRVARILLCPEERRGSARPPQLRARARRSRSTRSKRSRYRTSVRARGCYSIGTVGCNWRCLYCQNAEISQEREISGRALLPKAAVAAARRYGCAG